MALTIKRTSPLRARILPTLLMIFALMLQPMYGLVAGQVVGAVSLDPFFSTNEDNKNTGKPYVELVSNTVSSVTLRFVNPTNLDYRFEYRIDNSAPTTAIPGLCRIGVEPLASACEGRRYLAADDMRYVHVSSVKNTIVEQTFNSSNNVAIRSSHGLERKWDFDWVTFSTLVQPVAPTSAKWTNSAGATLGAYTNVNNVNMAWTASPDSDIAYYEYSYKSSHYSTDSYTSGTWSNGYNEGLVTNIPNQVLGTASGVEGTWEFRIRAVNNDGIASEWAYSPVLTFDRTAPVINHVSPLAGSAIGRIASFEFNATDSLSGVRNVNLHLMQGNDTKKIVQLTQDGATDRWYANNVDLNSLASGDYAIVSRATDNANNTQFVNSNHGKVTLDKSRPTVTLVAPVTSSVKGKLNVQVDATDPVRGLQSITANIYKDGSLFKGSTSSVSGLSASHNALFDLADGTYVIRYNARNSLGNISETKEFTVSVDNTAPKSSNIRYEQIINGNIGGQFRILVDLEDPNGVNLDKKYTWARVHLGGKEYSYAFSKVEGTERTYEAIVNTFDFVAVNNFTPGANITLRFADSLLNGSSTKPKTIQGVGVDNSGPSYMNSTVNSGDYIGINHSKIFAVSFHDHTGVSSASLTLKNKTTGKQEGLGLSQNSDGSWSGDMSGVLTRLGDGVYDFSIRPIDLFGRPRSNTSSVKGVTVDTVAPVTSLSNIVNSDGSVDVIGSIVDENLSHYWLTIAKDGTNLSLPNTNRYVYTDEFTDEVLGSFSEPGVYTVKLEARDKANNKDNTLSVSEMTFTISESTEEETPETETPVEENPGDEDEGEGDGTTSNTDNNEGTGGESPNTGGDGQPAVFTSPIFAFVPSLTDSGDQAQNESDNNESEVLGDQDPEEGADLSDTGEVMGIMDHKWFGLAWYWYLVILGALIGGWLLLAGAIRRRREEEEA